MASPSAHRRTAIVSCVSASQCRFVPSHPTSHESHLEEPPGEAVKVRSIYCSGTRHRVEGNCFTLKGEPKCLLIPPDLKQSRIFIAALHSIGSAADYLDFIHSSRRSAAVRMS